MAFLYTLTNAAVTGTDPAGTDLVSLGDDNIRNFKSAVLERLNSAFVDANSQPMILKSPAAGVGNVQSVIPTADNTFVLGEAARRWASIQAVLITGTQQTAAQPNITSLGALTGLLVNGTVTIPSVFALSVGINPAGAGLVRFSNGAGIASRNGTNTGDETLIFLDAANVTQIGGTAGVHITGPLAGNLSGTVLTPAQGNITSLGTLTGLTINSGTGGFIVTGDIKSQGASGGFIIGRRDTSVSAWEWYSAGGTLQLFDSVGTVDRLTLTSTLLTLSAGLTVTGTITGNLSGTLLTAAQGNITSLGTLTALTVGFVNANTTTGAGIAEVLDFSRVGTAKHTVFIAADDSLQIWDGTRSALRVSLSTAGVLSVFQGIIANISGNLTGTILTPAQGNITSLGTLSSLAISGDLSVNRIRSGAGATFGGGGLAGDIVTRRSANTGAYYFGEGANDFLFFDGTKFLFGGTSNVQAGGTFVGNLSGTILTAAQANITSLGVLTSLSVSGLITASGGITVGSNLQGVGRFALGNGLGAQITLAKVSTVTPTVANAAQQAWLKVVGDDAITYFVPAFT